MSRNGSGVYTLPKPAFVPNTTISSADVNADFSDIATALTGSLASDGQTPLTGVLKFLSGTIGAPSHSFAADLTTGMYYPGVSKLGFSAGAIGAIILDTSKIGSGQDGSILTYANGSVIRNVGELALYAGTIIPTGWFLCFGQAVGRVTYPELFNNIGTAFGSGDGVNTFNLPDMRGRAPYGKDNMGGGTPAGRITTAGSGVDGTTLGAAGGVQNVTMVLANLPPYTPAGTVSTPTITTNITNGTNLINANAGSSFGGGPVGATTTVTASSSSSTPTFTGTAQGGTSTPVVTLSPGMIINIIIFAGRP